MSLGAESWTYFAITSICRDYLHKAGHQSPLNPYLYE